MKKLFTILFSSLYFFSQAQTPGSPIGGIVVKGGKNPGGNLLLSLSGGINNPGSDSKTNARLINGYTFNGNVYVPLFAKDGGLAGRTSHFFTIGLNAGGEYFSGSKAYDLNTLPSYQISGQNTAPTFSLSNNQNKQHGFKAEVGVQASFTFGQVTISPLVDAGYFSLQQKALSVTQSGSVNGKAYSKEIYNQEAIKTTGLAISPKLRIAYFPGKLGFYLEGNYTSGPSVKNEATVFKPQGYANADGFYSQDQMLAGTNQQISEAVKFNSLGLNFGLSIPLGNARRKPRGKVTKPGDNGMLKVATPSTDKPVRTYTGGRKNETSDLVSGNPIGGIIVKGGKNPGGNFITAVTNENGEFEFTATEAGNYKFSISSPEPQGKSISEKGLKRTEVVAMAKPGNPIGGIIVKGGKNPGGSFITIVTNEKGEFELNNLSAGAYKFTITAPQDPQDKSISEKGVSSTKSRKN